MACRWPAHPDLGAWDHPAPERQRPGLGPGHQPSL